MANHSQQQNTTSSFPLFSASECTAWLTVFGVETVAIVTLNALAIIVYMRERSLRKRSLFLVINQAVADMLVAGCVIIDCFLLGSHCKFWTSINFSNVRSVIVTNVWCTFMPLASVTNLAAISLERMHATFRPFKHRLVKKNTFGAAVAAIWFTTGLCSAMGVLVDFYRFTIKLRRRLNASYFTLFFFLLLTILVSYSSIAIKIMYGNQRHHHCATRRERKLTKTLFIVTFVSLVLMKPFIILRILAAVSAHTFTAISQQMVSRLYYSFLFLFWANTLINPVCYAFRIPEFRRALFSFWRCRSQPQPAQVFPLNEM